MPYHGWWSTMCHRHYLEEREPLSEPIDEPEPDEEAGEEREPVVAPADD